jgi:hypothetical protein
MCGNVGKELSWFEITCSFWESKLHGGHLRQSLKIKTCPNLVIFESLNWELHCLIFTYIYVCVCVCVCERERERERERGTLMICLTLTYIDHHWGDQMIFKWKAWYGVGSLFQKLKDKAPKHPIWRSYNLISRFKPMSMPPFRESKHWWALEIHDVDLVRNYINHLILSDCANWSDQKFDLHC